MPHQPIKLPWEDLAWLTMVNEWIHAQLAQHGWTVAGQVEILHQRPWSTFASIPTDHGTVFFKAPAPVYNFEAPLTQALARWQPDCTVPLLAIDLEAGWLLTADAGNTLRSVTRSPDQIEHWMKVIPRYVELQLDSRPHVSELLAAGVPDRRLESLPHQFRVLLEADENLRVGLNPGLTEVEYRHLLALRGRFAAVCEQLASYGIPETLVHEEVHENNVLVRDGQYFFTDWSDSSISHPFFSMLVTMRSIAHWLKLDENGPELRRVRDAYLEPWRAFETRENLKVALDLAYRLAMVNRALSWHEGTGALPAEHKQEYADSVPGWLQDYLEAETAALKSEQ